MLDGNRKKVYYERSSRELERKAQPIDFRREAQTMEKKVYIPIIIDRNGKQYENVSYTDKNKAVDALHEFIDSFRANHSERIKRAYVLTIVR